MLASIGTGYAYIKSDLNINGTANVTRASWDVHFENLNVTTGSVTASTPASITDDTTVEFATTLDEPNDFYEFTVDVVNEGTMDAMIDIFSISPTLTTAQAKYLEYTITYEDDTELESKQELKANATETIKVRFNYIENSDKTNYPTEDQSFIIEFSVDYIQADSSSIPVRIFLYRSNQNVVHFGDGISSLGRYSTTQPSLNTFGYNTFLRHRIKNNQVFKSDVGLIYNDNTYYILAGGATYNSSTNSYNNDSVYYETNKSFLQSIFGSNNCTEYLNRTPPFYKCTVSDAIVYAFLNGYIDVTVDDQGSLWTCNVNFDTNEWSSCMGGN